MKGILFNGIAALALAGVIVSAVSLQRHFAKSETSYCQFGQKFNCDIVNRSEYSVIAEIPVAGIGLTGYAVLFMLAAFGKSRDNAPNLLLGTAIMGLGFALRLTYIEAYDLQTWCILCLISLALIVLITLLAIMLKVRTART